MKSSNLNTSRFSGIFQIPEIFPVAIIGAGGIGATTALTLAKMGVSELVIYDDDVVSAENTGTQFHKISDIGNPKVDMLGDAIWKYAQCATNTIGSRFTADTVLPFEVEILVSAVDSITARQEIWQAVNPTDVRWYIDARMAALELQLFIVDMSDEKAIAQYDQSLMSLSETDIEELPCTEKSTFFLGMLAAAYVGAEVMHIVMGEGKSKRLIHHIGTNFLYITNL